MSEQAREDLPTILSVANKLCSCGSGPCGRAVRNRELYHPGQPGRVTRNLAKKYPAHLQRVIRNLVRNVACPLPSVLRKLDATRIGAFLGTLCARPRARPRWLCGSPGRRLGGSLAARRSVAVRLGGSAAGCHLFSKVWLARGVVSEKYKTTI